jgi:hypothetical protein
MVDMVPGAVEVVVVVGDAGAPEVVPALAVGGGAVAVVLVAVAAVATVFAAFWADKGERPRAIRPRPSER